MGLVKGQISNDYSVKKIFFILFIILFLLCFASPVHATDPPSTILAVYMIGSDLEYDPQLTPEENAQIKESATKDIREMVLGWGDGSDNLEVIIAYGGSQKEGWEGMTVATLDNLKKDLDNDNIGDSEDSYLGWEDVSMCSEDGLSLFLSLIQKNYSDSRVILIFWDHGFAYQGFGRDDNYPDTTITPNILWSAFKKSGVTLDLIGFDACFMADIEFLRFISPYTRYVVASEETEPDHGWDYQEIILNLINNPDISSEELGKLIIDSYLNNPEHQKGALSLSLLNLSHLPKVLSAFNDLSLTLDSYSEKGNSYPSLSRWIGRLSGLGVTRDKDGNQMEIMVDLLELSRRAAQEIPDVSSEASALEGAIQDLIIYSRHDTPITQLQGIGVFSPVMSAHPYFYQNIREGTVLELSENWITFLNTFAEQIRSDTTPPKLTADGEEYQLEEDGYCLITDVFYQYQDDGSRIILGQEPSGVDDNRLIPKPEWDGTGVFIGDDATSSILPVYYVQTNDDGVQLYYAWGILTQGNAKNLVRMDFWYNSESGALQWIFRPYFITSDGYQEFSRSSADISPGDNLSIFSRVIKSDGSFAWSQAGQIIWSEKTKIQKKAMPEGKYGIEIVAMDLAGNTGYSGIIPYEVS